MCTQWPNYKLTTPTKVEVRQQVIASGTTWTCEPLGRSAVDILLLSPFGHCVFLRSRAFADDFAPLQIPCRLAL